MNPHKMNKVDISQMSEEDQKAFKKYGKLPTKNVLTKMQKDRKYFDSGDYMMNKAGVQSAQAPGTAIPTPEGLPHAFSPPNNLSPATGASPSTSPSLIAHGHTGLSPTSSQSSVSGGSIVGNGNAAPATSTGTAPIAVPSGGAHHSSGSQSSAEGERPQFISPFASGQQGVGVGISPAVGSDAMDVPVGGHRRRPSESYNRTSPPAVMREGSITSSFPIQHPGSFGSSPVKTSLLARRMVDQNE